MKLLEGKVAIVTGAARGIGEGIAIKLAEHGAHIAFTYVSESSADKAKALEEKLPAKRFMRVHRSFIVSLDKVTSMTKNSVQIGKMMIAVGDQYKEAFSQFVGKWI